MKKLHLMGYSFPEDLSSLLAQDDHKLRFTYNGEVVLDEEATGLDFENPVGKMLDQHGASSIRSWHKTKTNLSFVKQYDNRTDFIIYNFSSRIATGKYRGEWYGTWEGEIAGRGFASCRLLEISDVFQTQEMLAKLLAAR